MKLYNIIFDEPQVYTTVRDVAKKADPSVVVVVNPGPEKRSFEVQSERAANAIVKTFGGKLSVIDYDVTNIYK